MNPISRCLHCILLLALVTARVSAIEIRLTPEAMVEFADAQRGAQALATTDTFIESLSPFDRAARKQTDQPVSTEEFLRFISSQALPWDAAEITRLGAVFGSISNKLASYTLNLPEKILLIKTTGKEEGNAAYCRNKDAIVLPQTELTKPPQKLEEMLIHELFHLITRNNPKVRETLYGIVGFKPCSGIELPEPLKSRKITNPDAPSIQHCIEVTVSGKAVSAAPILFSNQPNYDVASRKNFFAYLTFRLLVIEQTGERWQAKIVEDRPWLLDIAEVKGFYEQIGRNTGYIIHPEEVLADNFALLVAGKRDLPTPEITGQMRKILLKP
jgi:hypothetical protein